MKPCLLFFSLALLFSLPSHWSTNLQFLGLASWQSICHSFHLFVKSHASYGNLILALCAKGECDLSSGALISMVWRDYGMDAIRGLVIMSQIWDVPDYNQSTLAICSIILLS